MRRIMIGVLLLVVSPALFAQDLSREIGKLTTEIERFENSRDRGEDLYLLSLKRSLEQRKRGFHLFLKRASSVEEVEKEKEEISKLEAQIATIEAERAQVGEENLQNLKHQLATLQAEQKATYREVPVELTALRRNRRLNANVLRRQEIGLKALEQRTSAGGAAPNFVIDKIIIDNKNSRPANFIFRPLDGGEKLAVSLAPKSKETHCLIPGSYQVEILVNGYLQGIHRLTIDGSLSYYEGEPCAGFAYTSAY